MKRMAGAVLVACIILLPAALAPLIGFAGVGVSGLLAVVALLAGRRGRAAGWWAWLPVPVALLGSIVGVSSVITAFTASTADRENAAVYAARAGFGWVALLCAVVAAVVGMLAVSQPRVTGGVLLLGGLVGGIAINLFYINTWYGGAVLLWWLGALVALVVSKRRVHA